MSVYIEKKEFKSKTPDELPIWSPAISPLYDIHKSYLENAEEGPFFEGFFPERQLPTPKKWKNFLGFPIASPLGVPAGPLFNARWVAFAAKMGFDVLTYKTIRSQSHLAHPVPNMVYVKTEGTLRAEQEGEKLEMTSQFPASLENLAVTNSFGIPSRDPSFVIEDIARAHQALNVGQVLIVSIVGTPRPNEDFYEDFVHATHLALEGGAKIIEADFSCPNVATCEGSIHTNPETIFEISSRMRKAIGDRPLVIKVGVIHSEKVMKEVMTAAAKAGVQAICGINTMSMRVVKEDGTPALGPNRQRAGVCGGPIRQVAMDFVRMAHKINKQEKLDLTLMATGGVTLPEHFDDFLNAGADIAMSAVGMMWDPYLAHRYHRRAQS